MDTQGEAREVLGALEWKGSTGTATVTVSIVPGEGETTLEASTDRTESLAGLYASSKTIIAKERIYGTEDTLN